jgi:hypothetical protein
MSKQKDVVNELIQVFNPSFDIQKIEDYNQQEYILYDEYENIITDMDNENNSKQK